jgi:hypothetical protein
MGGAVLTPTDAIMVSDSKTVYIAISQNIALQDFFIIFVQILPQTMKYDVFISYSRDDMEIAQSVCRVFDAYKKYYKFEYFFDTSEIKIKNEYLDRIATAISQSKSMVFLASKHSYASRFCAKELLYADEYGVGIYRYSLDVTKAPKKIDFLLIDQHYLDSELYSIEEMVVQVLADTLQQDVRPLAELQRKKNDEVSMSPNTVSVKTYKVGDYYNENGKEGVVFEVTADGRHGKIVSMIQSAVNLKWSSDDKSLRQLIGADSEKDGAYNMSKVMEISGWRSKYPAFLWCADLGDDWYLPSIEELKTFVLNEAVNEAINATLVSKGGESVYNKESKNKWYWSSTETDRKYYGQYFVRLINVSERQIRGSRKSNGNTVRAVATF